MKAKRGGSGTVGAIVVLFFLLLLLLFPGIRVPPDRWSQSLWNCLHLPAFFGITWMIHSLLSKSKDSFGCVALSAGLAILVGLAVELLQGFVGRSPSMVDLLINAGGAMLAAIWLGLLRGRGRKGKVALAAVIGLALVLCLTPAWIVDLARVSHERHLPEIGAFSSWSSRHVWKSQGNTVVEFPGADLGMKVKLGPGDFGGVTFLPGSRDWSGSGLLALEFRNEGEAFDLGIRIDNASTKIGDSSTWFSDAVTIASGDSSVDVKLPGKGSAGAIDFSEVVRLTLFTLREETPREFFVVSAFLRP